MRRTCDTTEIRTSGPMPTRRSTRGVPDTGARPNRSQSRTVASVNAPPSIFSGTGELASLMRSKNWSATPLGPVEAWPHELVQSVRTMLELPFAMSVLWGPEFIQLYNDTYRPFLG